MGLPVQLPQGVPTSRRMHPLFKLTRARKARSSAVLLALVALAVVPGSAQAAIAAGGPQINTNQPDLTSATIIAPNGAGARVQFCFDAPITNTSTNANPGGAGGDFRLIGYDANENVPSVGGTTTTLGSNCVNVGFGAVDVTQYT